jgi:hypothetical protein
MEPACRRSMDVVLQVEEKMGWQRRNMVGGPAACLAGNYMAYMAPNEPG